MLAQVVADALVVLVAWVLRQHRAVIQEELHRSMVLLVATRLGRLVLELHIISGRMKELNEGMYTGWVVVPPASVHVSSINEGNCSGCSSLLRAWEQRIVSVDRGVHACGHGFALRCCLFDCARITI